MSVQLKSLRDREQLVTFLCNRWRDLCCVSCALIINISKNQSNVGAVYFLPIQPEKINVKRKTYR